MVWFADHLQRYSYYRAAARRYRRRTKEPLRRLHLLTCVADDKASTEQARSCGAYLDDLRAFLSTELHIETYVSNCAHSMFEDFSIMYHAPFLISTGSTMSLLPGLAHLHPGRSFLSPLLFDEEAIAANSRAPYHSDGCRGCTSWMIQRDHALCHCEVPAYAQTKPLLAALRQPLLPLSQAPPYGLCPRCDAVSCEHVRLGGRACAVRAPSSWAPPDPAVGVAERNHSLSNGVDVAALVAATKAYSAQHRGGRTGAVRAANCAAAGAAPMGITECRVAASREGFWRTWLGSSRSKTEPPGCLLWADGNVEYNTRPPPKGRPPPLCRLRGTCLCRAPNGDELQVVGSDPTAPA